MWWIWPIIFLVIGLVILLFHNMFFPPAEFLNSVAEKNKKELEKIYGEEHKKTAA